jgi:RND family efflux transporter MFP subunit
MAGELKNLRIDRPDESGRGRGWLWLLAALLAFAAAGGGWWWATRTEAASVRTAVVRESADEGPGAVLNASGYVTARRRATVSSKVTGKVIEVLVEEGLRVREGQVLARLDPTTAEAQLRLSEAQLLAARRTVTESEVRLKEARLNLGRQRELVKEGVQTRAALDTAEAEVDSLVARIDAAREQVAVAEREVALQRTLIEDLTIRAPFSGVAISKDAQPGEMVSPISAGGGFTRTGISTIVDMSSLEIEVDVSESYINRVKPDQRVQATLDAYPDWQIPAHVITTVPAADRQKATVLVRIGFDALDPRILPDMGVKVAFLEERTGDQPAARRRLFVPRAAVREENGVSFVLVVAGETVERRALKLGGATGDEIEVLAGLNANERVVVEGPPGLRSGDRITVTGT